LDESHIVDAARIGAAGVANRATGPGDVHPLGDIPAVIQFAAELKQAYDRLRDLLALTPSDATSIAVLVQLDGAAGYVSPGALRHGSLVELKADMVDFAVDQVTDLVIDLDEQLGPLVEYALARRRDRSAGAIAAEAGVPPGVVDGGKSTG
jgi:hypothetical protein